MEKHSPLLDRVAAEILPVTLVAGQSVHWPIEERLALYRCPGAAICIIENGQVGEARGFGLREAGGAGVEADTMFAGASISKPVAAVLALQLVDQGIVELDAPINRYLKTWQLPDNEFTKSVPVTLRHLLSHKAGTTVHGFGAFPVDQTPPSLLDILNGRPPSPTPAVIVDKLPGTSVRYSGGGTQIVQLLLEEKTGKRFAELARERVFEPLGMSRTTFEQPLPVEFAKVAAVGHGITGEAVAGRYTFTPQLAAGGIYTSAPDYARFMVECRDAWLGKPNVLLSQRIAQTMMTRQEPGQFGLGWEVFGSGNFARFGHGGSNEGYQCNTTCFLEQGVGAVVLTNAMLGIILYYELLNTIANVYGWKGYLRPPKEIQTVPPERQALYSGRYRIVSGIDAPYTDIWTENGQLHSRTEGLIFPPRPIYLGTDGRFFNQQSPSETAVIYDEQGRANTLVTYATGEVEIMRAVRQEDQLAQ